MCVLVFNYENEKPWKNGLKKIDCSYLETGSRLRLLF